MAITHGIDSLKTEAVYLGGGKFVDEAVAEAAITPGALLVRGATAGDVVEAGDGALNVIGYALENDHKADDASLLTDFALGDEVPYNMAGSLFAPIVANAEVLQHGDKIVAAAGGEVRKYAPQSDTVAGDAGGAVIGHYAGHADVTGDGVKRAVCVFYGGL